MGLNLKIQRPFGLLSKSIFGVLVLIERGNTPYFPILEVTERSCIKFITLKTMDVILEKTKQTNREARNFSETALPRKLRQSWLLFVAQSSVATATLAFFLHWSWGSLQAGLWFLSTLPALSYIWWQSFVLLPQNRPSVRDSIYETFSPATKITLLRALFTSWLAGFLLLPWPAEKQPFHWLSWLPGILYLLVGISDFLDGFIARVTGSVTLLGEQLDTRMDGFGLLVAPILAIHYGQFYLSYGLVSVAYYLFLLGLALRRRKGLHVFPLDNRLSGRLTAGFQMGLVGLVLLPVFSPPATAIAGFIFMIPFLFGFVRDWLFATGQLQNTLYFSKFWTWSVKIATLWLPLLGRLFLLACAFWFAKILFQPLENTSPLFSWEMQPLVHPVVWETLSFFVLLLFVGIGILPRLAGFILTIGIALSCTHFSLFCRVVYTALLVNLLAGPGSLALFPIEEKFLSRKAGSAA